MSIAKVSLAVVAAMLVAAQAGSAQADPPPEIRPEGSVGGAIFGGVAMGAVGFFGGVLVGHGLSQGCTGYFCDVGGAALGAIVGETVGAAVGAHFGNNQRGHFGLDLLVSGTVAFGGISLASDSDAGTALLVVLAVQISAVVAVERKAGRAKERGATVSVTPTGDGGAVLGMTFPLP